MAPVTLRVYDLSRGLARQMSTSILGKQIDGIWHTGVLVFGHEYFFGGGIQMLAPELVVARYGMQPVQQIPLGETTRSQSELETFLRSVSRRFTAATYDLLRHNCNNFSNEVSTFLLGRGIPQHILDLPNEALSTPMGAMLRPMLENLQGGSQAFGNPFNDPTLSTSPMPTFAAAPVSASRTISSLSRKFTISGSPTLHLDKIVRQLQRVNSQGTKRLSDADVVSLQALVKEMTSHQVDLTKVASDDTKMRQWWKILRALMEEGPQSQFFFPALGVFRVLLLLPTRSSVVLELKNHCFDLLQRVVETEAVLSNAQVVLLLTVLVNGFANPTATELVQARALQFLPFVFRSITESDPTKKDVRVMSAKLISNCCLAMKMEEEIVITTIICGCAEVMDQISREVATTQNVQLTLEGVVVGVGLLLQNFQAARSLCIELGLGDVLRRLHSSPSLRSMQSLLSEVVALI